MQQEQRLHPRLKVDLPAELEAYDGDSVDVRLLNLSAGGVLVEGDEQLEAQLKLRQHNASGIPVEVNLHFGLDQEPVHCHCRLVHMQRLSQNCYRLGLKILSIDEPHQQLLNRYIEVNS